MLRWETRNPNVEIRNKFEIPMFQGPKRGRRAAARFRASDFFYSSLFRISEFVVRICARKERYLGKYDDPVEAAKARDRKADALHGPLAHINLPKELQRWKQQQARKKGKLEEPPTG